jgi:predicted 3-demethylubiquinone-9 3-methyltransferase (glyoxalase superfamily)
MQEITPFLWFDGRAEEAMNFYTSVFKNAKPGKIARHGDARPGAKGSVMPASFELEGQQFYALKGGPQFTFTPAVSFFVDCETQEEVNYFWDRLSDSGKINVCGWLQVCHGRSFPACWVGSCRTRTSRSPSASCRQ